MIIKEKAPRQVSHQTARAGDKQEFDVAFYLNRAFKNHPKVMVFNDIKISYEGENAQIDHLILYPYGFVLIESKSITGEVSVNQHQEWQRSYKGQWRGMPSPIKQVELQQRLLKELLFQHRTEILPSFLMVKQGFGGRCWDNLCTISSNAIIDRESIPKAINEQMVKNEFLVEKLEKIMKLKFLALSAINIMDTRPTFSDDEMASIAQFLLAQDKRVQAHSPHIEPALTASESQFAALDVDDAVQPTSAPVGTEFIESPLNQQDSGLVINICCKHCGSNQGLVDQWGKFGYYVKCGECSGNTPMKNACPVCASKEARVSKKGESYTLQCKACNTTTPLHFAP
ncbi:NERD domain-containing protein [Shewanella submarina]|uniref:Nuclease-related domain-containing protein n=1 Tax=Shewanella submarina TaxID=2016376 RepID=A0ABV7GKQ6_9GAMM|nr:nuclease-related domain-containing protein [Shewanella submarina]MCL1039632.1 NERD domain-containing protein [Shewanella submarina]